NSAGIRTSANTSARRIGGSASGAGNLITGNSSHGAELGGRQTTCFDGTFNPQATPNTSIHGTRICSPDSGTLSFPKGSTGIAAGPGGTTSHLIGGTGNGEGNIIAFNGLSGVSLINAHTAVLGNSIFSNAQLGIDIPMSCAVNANDAGDA